MKCLKNTNNQVLSCIHIIELFHFVFMWRNPEHTELYQKGIGHFHGELCHGWDAIIRISKLNANLYPRK